MWETDAFGDELQYLLAFPSKRFVVVRLNDLALYTYLSGSYFGDQVNGCVAKKKDRFEGGTRFIEDGIPHSSHSLEAFH